MNFQPIKTGKEKVVKQLLADGFEYIFGKPYEMCVSAGIACDIANNDIFI